MNAQIDASTQQVLFATPAKSHGPELPERAPLRVASLFAGIGGFELGLGRAGHEPRLACEIWDPAVAVLESRFPGMPIIRDVCELASDATRIPEDVTLLTAGFPCTDLSQAGMTAGIKGENSGLVYQVFRILHAKREAGTPIPWLIIENVSFMLQLSKGEAMEVIVTELERLGYKWAYRVVDSRAFGVPQRRQRVFLVASTEEDPRDIVLSDDVGAPPKPAKDEWTGSACGFYWTEGVRGLGWAHDAVPTLKGGSTVGIPSAPAIVMPDGRLVKPDIRDAERMQGFDADWTRPAETVARAGFRWKLIGNAVTVDVTEWLGHRLRHPKKYDPSGDAPLVRRRSWPPAAWNVDGRRMVADVSQWPADRTREPLTEWLMHKPAPLSYRATRGFLNRATSEKCNLRFPAGFLDVVKNHLRETEPHS